jgi:hypothetical protein
MIFADRRLTIFGRAPDIKHLVGRANAKGMTAIAAPPKMGKTWLLIEVARKLSEEDGRLVGYAESVGQSADLMLRAVTDLYTRWLDNASYREQAKSLWQRHQGELITGAGQAVGAIFESFAETAPLKPVAKLVRECFDALARADTDLRTAGLKLPQLDYEKAAELVGLVADLSGKSVVLILDAWEQSPCVEFEFKALNAFLNHQDDWPLCHIFVGLRPDDVAWALARKLRAASPRRADL